MVWRGFLAGLRRRDDRNSPFIRCVARHALAMLKYHKEKGLDPNLPLDRQPKYNPTMR